MKIDLNKTISTMILIMGHILFFLNIEHQPSLAFIVIIGMFFVNRPENLKDVLFVLLYPFSLISIGLIILFGMTSKLK